MTKWQICFWKHVQRCRVGCCRLTRFKCQLIKFDLCENEINASLLSVSDFDLFRYLNIPVSTAMHRGLWDLVHRSPWGLLRGGLHIFAPFFVLLPSIWLCYWKSKYQRQQLKQTEMLNANQLAHPDLTGCPVVSEMEEDEIWGRKLAPGVHYSPPSLDSPDGAGGHTALACLSWCVPFSHQGHLKSNCCVFERHESEMNVWSQSCNPPQTHSAGLYGRTRPQF